MKGIFRTDANHKQIKAHLQSLRLDVYDFAKAGNGFPDLMVVNRQRAVILIELKFGARAKMKKTQMKFIGNYKGYVGFAETIEQAERLALDPVIYAIPQNIKNRIAVYEATFTEQEQLFSAFKKEVNL